MRLASHSLCPPDVVCLPAVADVAVAVAVAVDEDPSHCFDVGRSSGFPANLRPR